MKSERERIERRDWWVVVAKGEGEGFEVRASNWTRGASATVRRCWGICWGWVRVSQSVVQSRVSTYLFRLISLVDDGRVMVQPVGD